MARVWVNSKWLTSDNKKAEKWKPSPVQEKKFWGLCNCGEKIYEGDAVGMVADHEVVVCYACLLACLLGRFPISISTVRAYDFQMRRCRSKFLSTKGRKYLLD